MIKSLLLGNGINARIGVTGLSESEIKERFRQNVYKYSPLLEALYGITLSEDICNNTIQSAKSDGIESLAGALYIYIKTHVSKKWTNNDEIRLQDIVNCIALTSIFYNEAGRICTDYDSKKLLDMSEYKRIFTLNYVEFWDKKQECIYLHGRIELDRFGDEKNMLLASKERTHLQAYREAIGIIGKANSVKVIDTSDYIFAPDCLPKAKLVNVTGVYLSDNLYPADDLFLRPKKELYVQLKDVERLDIFGVSPYGDDSLIDVINGMKFVTVYVHNMNNIEVKAWEKILFCPHIFKDSSEAKSLASF